MCESECVCVCECVCKCGARAGNLRVESDGSWTFKTVRRSLVQKESVCASVWEREKERERVCVCERERERLTFNKAHIHTSPLCNIPARPFCTRQKECENQVKHVVQHGLYVEELLEQCRLES